jgi:hypothetical protein
MQETQVHESLMNIKIYTFFCCTLHSAQEDLGFINPTVERTKDTLVYFIPSVMKITPLILWNAMYSWFYYCPYLHCNLCVGDWVALGSFSLFWEFGPNC